MEPTLPHGTFFLYDQAYYRNHRVRSGDIVVVRHRGEVWIKRIYAAERSDFWTLRYGGYELVRHDPIRATQEGYFARAAARLRAAHGVDYRTVRMRVPPGCVFLVGDGTNSEDSRQFGPVAADEILGRVIALPGQRLGNIPEWVELSSPADKPTVIRAGRPQAVSGVAAAG
jgi:signal peptidase I